MANVNKIYVERDGQVYDIEDSTARSQIAALQAYSLAEIGTGEKWIDGKPIYRLVAECLTQGSTSATARYNGVDMTDYNMENLVHANILEVGGGQPQAVYEGCIYRVDMQSGKKMVSFYPSGQGWDTVAAGNTRYIVVEYTKTTD